MTERFVPLTIGVTANAATQHLPRGSLAHLGPDARVTFMHPSELFLTQLRDEYFDVSEMSVASLAIAYANGNRTWRALPIFTNRRFFFTDVVVRDDAGIDTPTDLMGARVGLPEYQQTAAVWTRGILSDEYGVDPRKVRWYMERLGGPSHAQVSGGRLPTDVEVNPVPADSGIGQMLGDADLDAVLHYINTSTSIDRTGRPIEHIPGTRLLFDPPEHEAARYFAKAGVVPMNHCVVVRATLIEANPWLQDAIVHAFEAAKRKAMTDFAAMYGAAAIITPWAPLTEDPLPYDLAGVQLRSIETLLRYLDEQGLVAKSVRVPDLFDV